MCGRNAQIALFAKYVLCVDSVDAIRPKADYQIYLSTEPLGTSLHLQTDVFETFLEMCAPEKADAPPSLPLSDRHEY